MLVAMLSGDSVVSASGDGVMNFLKTWRANMTGHEWVTSV